MSPAPRHRIALIHALEESILPARAAFARGWPEAFCFDLLDTSLAIDLSHAGELDTTLINRFHALGTYAAHCDGKAGLTRGILFTCSAFGPAIESVRARMTIPVLRPNEAAFSKALAAGSVIGLVVTFPPSLRMLQDELIAMAAASGRRIAIKPILVPGALDALQAGDGAGHDRLVVDACRELGGLDALVLGQFSLSRAAPGLREVLSVPVLTTPDCAVEALRTRVIEDISR
jgi:Asp/Glu/hydantoin racemase